jgi:hypothetical protein
MIINPKFNSTNVTSVKQVITDRFSELKEETGKLGDKVVKAIVPEEKTTVNFLQDSRIAALSVLAVSIIAFQLTKISDQFFENRIPHQYRQLRAPVNYVVSSAIYFGSLAAYIKLVPLPLPNSTVVVISLVTLIIASGKN